MYELVIEAFKSLPPYLQGIGTAIILLVIGPLIMRRAKQDLKNSEEGKIATAPPGDNSNMLPPHFLLISPVSDVFGAVHDTAEEVRVTNELLKRLIEVEYQNQDLMRYQMRLLEFIRNNQEMRGDPQPPPLQNFHREL